MATNRVVRDRILAKLKIKRQSLDSRAKALQKKLPMSKEDATYLIAFSNDVKIDDELDAETLERISRYHVQLSGISANSGPPPAPSATSSGARSRKTVVVKLAGIDIEGVPGLSAAHAKDARQMAEKAYPILYVFENSARDVIQRVLEKEFGSDWWSEVSWPDARKEVERRQKTEGHDAWHSKRGDNPLAYLDLSHLVKLVKRPNVWPLFESIFPRQTWFEGVVEDLTVSRRVVAHMNPLDDDDIQQVEAGFRKWVKQLRERADLIT